MSNLEKVSVNKPGNAEKSYTLYRLSQRQNMQHAILLKAYLIY